MYGRLEWGDGVTIWSVWLGKEGVRRRGGGRSGLCGHGWCVRVLGGKQEGGGEGEGGGDRATDSIEHQNSHRRITFFSGLGRQYPHHTEEVSWDFALCYRHCGQVRRCCNEVPSEKMRIDRALHTIFMRKALACHL